MELESLLFAAQLQRAAAAKTWSVSVCSRGSICHKTCAHKFKTHFYEFIKSLKRLISSSRCNRLAALVNTMGGQ